MTALKIGDTTTLSIGDVKTYTLDFSEWLDVGELLTGTPTVSQPTNTTIASVAINTAAVVDHDDYSIPIGMAVQFSFTSTTALADPGYALSVSAATDATVAQTKKGTVYIIVQ